MRRRFLAAASVAAFLSLGWGSVLGVAGAHAQSVPPTLEEGPLAGRPAGDVYQSAANLERTRNETYGQILAPAQHAEIASWRVASPAWWLDPARVDRALAVRASIAEAVAWLPDPGDAADALRDGDHLFGFETRSSALAGDHGGHGSAPPAFIDIEYSAATRPDLFLLHEALAGLMTSFQQRYREDRPAASSLFYTLFPHLGSSLGGAGQGDPLPPFAEAVDDYLEALFFDLRLSVHDYYSPIAAAHAANRFDDYQLDDALAYRHQITRLKTESYVRVGKAFLDGLDDDMRKALMKYLVRAHLPSLRKRVVYASHSTELYRIDLLRRGGE